MKGKKGIFFTLVSILLVIMLFVSFSSKEYITEIDRTSVIKDRIIKADNFFGDLDNHLERAVRVSSYTTLRALAEYIKNHTVFFPSQQDFRVAFEMAILTGQIINVSNLEIVYLDDEYGKNIMQGNTLTDKINDIENLSRRILFLETNVSIFNISIYQNNDTGPWDIGVYINASFSVNSSIAFWKKNINVSFKLDILSLEDPYYFVHANKSNFIENVFENISTDSLTIGFGWNISNLQKHIWYRTYKREELAPNFLMRFINDTGNSTCCGIESMIYFSGRKNMTFIDYCYWNETCPGSDSNGEFSLYNITGITNKTYLFKLEPYHMAQYNVTDYGVWYDVTPG